ncbi:MAG TPA: membrane protein insertion efficiency factor YidD [Candidatus Binataceae bacterium]|nr:membrane protein insertion efficiency factor YidD [Candidatus Binataceae bacterium]
MNHDAQSRLVVRFSRVAGSAVARAGRVLTLAALVIYRVVLSPILAAALGPACRFEPTCSEYASAAIAHHGAARGGWMAIRRLLRCRPGGGWGYDPVAGACTAAGEKRELLG